MGWIVSPHGKVLAIEMNIRSDDERKGRFYKRFFIYSCIYRTSNRRDILLLGLHQGWRVKHERSRLLISQSLVGITLCSGVITE